MSHDNRTQLPVGARVHHWGQQYDAALTNGTATIVAVIKQHQVDDTWEYQVQTDDGELHEWNMVDVPNLDLRR